MKEHQVVQSIDAQGFVPFNSVGGPLQEAVLPLIAKVDDRWWPVGTAFVVQPNGILVTARHVLEEAHSHAVPRQRADGSTYQHYELYAVYMSSAGGQGPDLLGGLLPVNDIWAITPKMSRLCVSIYHGTSRLESRCDSDQPYLERVRRGWVVRWWLWATTK